MNRGDEVADQHQCDQQQPTTPQVEHDGQARHARGQGDVAKKRNGNETTRSGHSRKRMEDGVASGAASSGARWPPRAASHRLTRKPQRHWQRSTANKLWARGRPRPDRVRGRPVRIRTTSQESRAGTRRTSGPFRRFAPKPLVSSAPVSALEISSEYRVELLVRGRPRPHSAPRCGVEGDADRGVRAPDGRRRIEPVGDEPPTRSNWASAAASGRCWSAMPASSPATRSATSPPNRGAAKRPSKVRRREKPCAKPSRRPSRCASTRAGSVAPRRASTPTTAQDRNSLDTGHSRHREVEQISRVSGPPTGHADTGSVTWEAACAGDCA